MKGLPGLLIALGLAVTGGLCNWFYITSKTRDLDLVEFIAVREGGVKAGQPFQESHFKPISVPRTVALRLQEAAPPFTSLPTVVGTTAYRDFREGEIVLWQDLETPPISDLRNELAPDEEAISVTVDSRGFVPSHFSAGQEISFIVSQSSGLPNRGSGETGPVEKIGPFFVLALGNRRGSFDRERFGGRGAMQENVITIRVKKAGENAFDPKVEQLLSRLRLTGNQALGVVMHAKGKGN